ILDGNRASLGRYNGTPSGELRGWVHVAGGTPIYVRVSQIYGVNEPYMLALASGPLVDASEPNGDLEHATPVADGGSVQAFLSNAANDPTSLPDWYRIDVARDRNLTLDVDMSDGIAPHVELFNANRRELTRQSGGPGERIQLVARVPRGTYYVKVGSTYGVPRAGQGALPPWLVRPYTLSAR